MGTEEHLRAPAPGTEADQGHSVRNWETGLPHSDPMKSSPKNDHADPPASPAPSPKSHAEHGQPANLDDPALYLNRELSLLAFQRRVLEEAEDPTNPLLERIRFLAILGSNLDEFFMVRVAGLAAQLDAGIMEVGPDRMTPRAQLISIRREVKKLLREAHECRKKLAPELEEHGIVVHEYSQLNEKQQRIAA